MSPGAGARQAGRQARRHLGVRRACSTRCSPAERAFEGDDVSDTLAAVLKTRARLDGAARATPAAIRRLLRRCLEKDRKRRLATSRDARLEIDEALAEPLNAVARATQAVVADDTSGLPGCRRVLVAIVAGGDRAGTLGRRTSHDAAARDARRDQHAADNRSHVAGAFRRTGRRWRSWPPPTASLACGCVRSTRCPRVLCPKPTAPPSRSGRRTADPWRSLRTVSSSRSASTADRHGRWRMPLAGVGGTWSRDGVILFSTLGSPILRISDRGGDPAPATRLGAQQGGALLAAVPPRWPSFPLLGGQWSRTERRLCRSARRIGDAPAARRGFRRACMRRRIICSSCAKGRYLPNASIRPGWPWMGLHFRWPNR